MSASTKGSDAPPTGLDVVRGGNPQLAAHARELAQLIIPALEVEIGVEFGVERGARFALENRCYLASLAMVDIYARLRIPAALVIGKLHVAHREAAPLTLRTHGWVRIGKRALIDPTIEQVCRARFPWSPADEGYPCFEARADLDLRKDAACWTSTSCMEFHYYPNAALHRLVLRTAPDAQPARWRAVASRVRQRLFAQR